MASPVLLACGLLLCGCKKNLQTDADKLSQAFGAGAGHPKSAPQAAAAPSPAVPVNSPENINPAAIPQPENSTASAPPQVNIQPLVHQAVTALQTGNFESAVTNMQNLKRTGQLTDSQAIAVRDAMIDVQRAIVEGLQAGDPKARRAAQILERSARGE